MTDDRTAVITGAASGLGLALALRAAHSGMRVVMADIEQAALDDAAALVSGAGAQVVTQRTDVAQSEAVDALARTVITAFGPPHLVVNNAGVGIGGPLWEHSPADWDWVAGVNLLAVGHGVRAFTPLMLAAAAADPLYRGHIVNTASMAGLAPIPNMGAYAVTKHAVVALSEILARDLALVTDQVRAAVLCPYFVPTRIGWSRRNRPDADGEPPRSQRVYDLLIQRATQSAVVTADDVANMVFDALRDERFYIFTHDELRPEAAERLSIMARAEKPEIPFRSPSPAKG